MATYPSTYTGTEAPSVLAACIMARMGGGGGGLPSHQQELDLGRRVHSGDGGARRHLVEKNLGLGVAGKYRGQGFPFEDLIQEGNIGFMKKS